MKTLKIAAVCLIVAVAAVATSQEASAQYGVTYQAVTTPSVAYTSVRNEVVGYQAHRAGLLGLRTQWNPVVAPVARTVVTPPTQTVVPVYHARPAVTLKPAPIAPAPVVSQPIAPVTAVSNTWYPY